MRQGRTGLIQPKKEEGFRYAGCEEQPARQKEKHRQWTRGRMYCKRNSVEKKNETQQRLHRKSDVALGCLEEQKARPGKRPGG